MLTKSDQNIKKLIELGYEKITNYPTRKYTVFKDKNSKNNYIFISSNISVRYGSSISCSNAIPINILL
jgi:hypothetical protein